MPAKTESSSKEQQQQSAPLKFEVSASKLFHIKLAGAPSQVAIDLALGDYGYKTAIPIPDSVQHVSGTAYGYVAPYAEWSYNKLLKNKPAAQ